MEVTAGSSVPLATRISGIFRLPIYFFFLPGPEAPNEKSYGRIGDDCVICLLFPGRGAATEPAPGAEFGLCAACQIRIAAGWRTSLSGQLRPLPQSPGFAFSSRGQGCLAAYAGQSHVERGG